MQFIGMVGIVIIHICTVEFTLALEAAAGAGKGGKAFLHSTAGDAQHIGRCGGSQRVEDVVVAVDMEA
jgi:hypothetical protein